LLELINDLLDISSLEVGENRLILKEVELTVLIQNIFNMFCIEAKLKGISYKISGIESLPKLAYVDGLRITQVMQNIISNAIKFTDHGNVNIAIETQASSNDSFLFIARISDTGLGIPQSKQQDIFTAFTQLDMDIAKRQKGSGLGLAICHQLCDLMRGNIEVESQPGKGSIFTVTLPMKITSDALSNNALANKKSIQTHSELRRQYNKRVLLVEDNIVNQKVTKKLLSTVGLHVVIANNGQQALDICKTEIFDMVLMDIQMPIMDGIQATELLSVLPNFTNTPIVALSASATQQDQLNYQTAGMSGFLAKPIRLESFVAEFDLWF